MRIIVTTVILGLVCGACTAAPSPCDTTTSHDTGAVEDTVVPGDTTVGFDTTVADTGVSEVALPPDVEPVSDTASGVPPFYLGGDRPATYFMPYNYDGTFSIPLIISLHGYSNTAPGQDLYFGLSKVTKGAGIMLIIPEGMVNPQGNQFWNATDACCDLYQSGVDDVAYISGLIEEAQTHFNIDPKRVYIVGHSNGGFMSYRMACDRSDLIAGVVSFAGSTWEDPADCGDPGSVAVLQIHGEWDTAILYDGLIPHEAVPGEPQVEVDTCLKNNCTAAYDSCLGDPGCAEYYGCLVTCSQNPGANACYQGCWDTTTIDTRILWIPTYTCGLGAGCYSDWSKSWAGYPSAPEIVARWAARNGCAETWTEGEVQDLIYETVGVDTESVVYDGCPAGQGAELWTIKYGSHAPSFTAEWAPAIVTWLLEQSKP